MLRRIAAVALVVLGATCATTACEHRVEATDCTAYQDPYGKAGGAPLPFVDVLLDLPANDQETAESIGRALRPTIGAALSHGAYLAIEADGGGATVATSSCFRGVNANAPFLVESDSPRADRDDIETGTDALVRQVVDFVRSVPVARHGTASRLLTRAVTTSDVARAAPTVSRTTVVLYSNLLGSGVRRDCLDLDGVMASARSAQDVVARCFHRGKILPLDVTAVRLLGVGNGAATPDQILLANSIATALCGFLNHDCHQGAPTP